MVIRKTLSSKIFDCVNIALLALVSIVTLYPFLYVVFASLSDGSQLETYMGMLWRPLGFSTDAYKMVLQTADVWIGYRNTLFYVVVGTVLNLILTSLGAYVLSRKNFFWNKLLMPMTILTMFFSGGLIPTFIVMKGLGLYDSMWAILLIGGINTWNLMIMKTNFASIPESLEEAARIDGANEFLILTRIVLPLSLPVIAVMVLYYGVGHWNAWFNSMIYLRDRNKFPLQLFLREILISSQTSDMMNAMDVGASDAQRVTEAVKYATIVVATVPILCVYPFLQKYFVKGVMVGAVKG